MFWSSFSTQWTTVSSLHTEFQGDFSSLECSAAPEENKPSRKTEGFFCWWQATSQPARLIEGESCASSLPVDGYEVSYCLWKLSTHLYPHTHRQELSWIKYAWASHRSRTHHLRFGFWLRLVWKAGPCWLFLLCWVGTLWQVVSELWVQVRFRPSLFQFSEGLWDTRTRPGSLVGCLHGKVGVRGWTADESEIILLFKQSAC